MTEFDTTSFWYEGKAWLKDAAGLSANELHIHGGLAIFLLSLLAFRHFKHRLALAWLTLFILQTLNEIMDARDWMMWTDTINWVEMAKDYALTLFWPSILCLFMAKMPARMGK